MHAPSLLPLLLILVALAIVWIWPSYWVAGGLTLAVVAVFAFALEEAAGRALSLDDLPLRLIMPIAIFAFAVFALAAWRKRSARSKSQ